MSIELEFGNVLESGERNFLRAKQEAVSHSTLTHMTHCPGFEPGERQVIGFFFTQVNSLEQFPELPARKFVTDIFKSKIC